MDNGKKMLENLPREMLAEALKAEAVPAPEGTDKQPLGTVKRVLTMMDRNAVLGACQAYCQKDGHKGITDQTRLYRIKKLLGWDETLEYFAMIDDSFQDEVREWRMARNQYRLWQDCRAGLIKIEEIQKAYPGFDMGTEREKPSVREPELKPEKKRGSEKAVYLPSKLDSWAQDALRAMEWLDKMEEMAVEACEKFGVQAEA